MAEGRRQMYIPGIPTTSGDALGAMVARAFVLALAMTAFAPRAGAAQQVDSVRVRVLRAVTPYEVQVERLARSLVSQQRRLLTLAGTREQLRVSLRSAELPEGERGVLATQLRAVDAQLMSLETTRESLRRQLEELCAPSRQTEGWMGITFQSNFVVDLRPDGVQLIRFNGYPAIETVEPNSPAEKAGVRRGDVLLSLAGRELQDAALVFQELLKPGARLALRMRRGLETKSVTVTIEPKPADFQPTCAWEDDMLASALSPMPRGVRLVFPAPMGPDVGRVRSFSFETRREEPAEAPQPNVATAGSVFVFSGSGASEWAVGAQIAPVNAGLARITGVDRGVFVVDVAMRSPAALSGLRGGDVIVSVDGRPVLSPTGLRQLMERADAKELTLQIVRERKPESVVLKW